MYNIREDIYMLGESPSEQSSCMQTDVSGLWTKEQAFIKRKPARSKPTLCTVVLVRY